MKKNVILTFDYEVFLGQATGTMKKSVINTTEQILEVLIQNNAKAIFFVDATWLLFLKENFYDDFQLVSKQLQTIVEIGSSVELHLHPQWLQAYTLGDKIVFKMGENYRLHSLCDEDIIDLFRKSIELLENITSQKVRCFRAGGFCIEPFTKIKSAFEAFGIKLDFSVAPGMILAEGKTYDYDFSKAPNLQFYHFQDDVKIPETDGFFIEIPLSTYNNNPLYRVTNLLLLRLKKDKIFGDGKGIQENSYYFIRSLARRLRFSKAFLTFDYTSRFFFKFLIKYHFKEHTLLVIISHPKTISRQALFNLEFVTENFSTMNSVNVYRYLGISL